MIACLYFLQVVLACAEALLLAVHLELACPALILPGTVVRDVADAPAGQHQCSASHARHGAELECMCGSVSPKGQQVIVLIIGLLLGSNVKQKTPGREIEGQNPGLKWAIIEHEIHYRA